MRKSSSILAGTTSVSAAPILALSSLLSARIVYRALPVNSFLLRIETESVFLYMKF